MKTFALLLISLAFPVLCMRRNFAAEQKRIDLQNRLQQRRAAEEKNEKIRSVIKEVTVQGEEMDQDNGDSMALFNTVFKADEELGLRIPIDLREPLEEKKEKITYWIAINHHGVLESFFKVLRAVGPGTPNEVFKDGEYGNFVLQLVESQFLLFMNHHLKSVTDETLEAFVGIMKGYASMLAHIFDRVLHLDFESRVLSYIPPDNYPDVAFTCKHLMQQIHKIITVLDYFTNYWDSVTLPDIDCYRFDKLYVFLKNAYTISEESVNFMFNQVLPKRSEYAKSNAAMKAEFRERVRSIRASMDNQFPDKEAETQEEKAVEEKKPERSSKINRNRGPKGRKNDPKKGKNNQRGNRALSDLVRDNLTPKTEGPVEVEPKTEAAPKPKVNTHQIRKQEAAANREAKAIVQAEKAKKKHEERVNAITIKEDDDKDVIFYYSMMGPDANMVYNDNQAAQACKRVYASSDRFKHSIFPEITASGETINFLCELLVSGTPDYDGFLSAHNDLGGEMVEKTNGNKMFFFKDPIKYHKTLHRPHLSSDFDHRLYRRFYRNCGLHPYFFVLF